MANVARLGVVLGMDSAEFVKGLEQAKRQIFNFQNALRGGAFAAFGAQLVRWADDLNDTADAYETTIERVIQLKEALNQSGGSAENAGRMLGTFINKLDEAASGGKAAQDSLKKIGIGLNDIANLSSDQLFSKTVEQLAKIDDPVRRNAAAFDVFGKAIRGVDIRKLNDELKQNTSITDAQKDGITAAAEAADMFTRTWGELNKVTAEFIGPLAKGLAQVFEDIVDGIDRAINGIKSLLSAFDELLAKIPRLPATGGDEYDAAISGAIDTATGSYTRKDSASSGGAASKAAFRGGRSVTAAKDSKLDQLLKELATIQQIADSYGTSLEYQLQGINLQTSKINMTQNEAQIAQVLFDLEKKRADQIAQLQDKIAIARQTGADQKVIDALNQQIAKVNELTDAYQNQITMATEANQILSQSFEGGLLESWKKFQFEAINTAEVVSSSVDALFSGMTNALTSFIVNGKLSFADFTKAIVADLIRIQLQSVASGIFSAILGAGLSALTNNALGPGFVGPPMPARAAGGPVDSGTSYLVGENGPEIFTPSRSGAIIPNNQLGGMGGGATYVTNNYIDAIDTKSFEDRLYGSSRAVWAANQYANKNISNSRTRS